MRQGFELSLRQVQKLVMTPQLRQAITVLQLPAMELREFLEREALDNPMLELADDREVPDSSPAGGTATDGGADGGSEAGGLQSESSAGVPAEDVSDVSAADGPNTQDATLDWAAYFDHASDLGIAEGAARGRYVDDDRPGLESFATSSPSLQDHLLEQLRLTAPTSRQKVLGAFIIWSLDDDGYLRTDVRELARRASVSVAEAEDALRLVQTFEPAGVGARNLRECLDLQLEVVDVDDCVKRTAEKLITSHLEDLADGKLAKIARDLGESLPAVQKACDLIRSLDPKPGRECGGARDATYVTPDVVVEGVGDDYVVTVNDTMTPRLSINPVYRRMLRAAAPAEGGDDLGRAAEFLKKRLNSALWLIKSIEQRRMTLTRVTEAIVRVQRPFLEGGIAYLRPLTLKEVGDEVGVHESTVSRATSGKYVQTPRGTFPFRFFFTAGLSTTQGEMASAQTVRKLIADLVRGEDPRNPLSDHSISSVLARQGIIISRRTVAKYREEMMIPSSGKRKRY